jgi:intracellular septation protein A
MKKMLVIALLSSTMIFAVKPAVVVPVKAAVVAAKTVVTKIAPVQSCKLAAVVSASMNYLKNHKLVAGSAVVVAGVATLYYTNAEFRAMVRGWLGLDTEAKK